MAGAILPGRNAIRWIAAIAIVAAIIVIALTILASQVTPMLRERAIRAMEERYQSKVRIGALNIHVFPRLTLSGDDVEFRHHGRTDVPPMITIRHFSANAALSSLSGPAIHIRELRLEGLAIQIARKHDGESAKAASAKKPGEAGKTLVIDEVNADGTLLRILPKKEGKEPLEFEISKLKLHSVGRDRPMEFRAILTNPKPPGLIHSTGHFGPWESGEPGNSAVDGDYTFQNADLSVFKGISGILSSTGKFGGRLNRIDVQGRTDTPDFTVRTGGHPVRLTTDFHAVVDGTDGDTYLLPVNAKFLQSVLVCNGKVEHQPGTPGKAVQLDVEMAQGRIEDLLVLAVKGNALMTGPARLKTKFLLPPGKGEVMERLKLAGSFSVAAGKFTKNAIQEKVTDLSLRGQGRAREAKETNTGADATAPENVASDLRCDFALDNAKVTFSKLAFAVPGAKVALDGSYGLKSEELDFTGVFQMDAKVSQAFTGWKSILLKPADPFFRKRGGRTEIPIRITGTRGKPSFGLQLFGRKKDSPRK